MTMHAARIGRRSNTTSREHREAIFAPFHRLHRTSDGAGLGLAIVVAVAVARGLRPATAAAQHSSRSAFSERRR